MARDEKSGHWKQLKRGLVSARTTIGVFVWDPFPEDGPEGNALFDSPAVAEWFPIKSRRIITKLEEVVV
jgi:hypothetical protein